MDALAAAYSDDESEQICEDREERQSEAGSKRAQGFTDSESKRIKVFDRGQCLEDSLCRFVEGNPLLPSAKLKEHRVQGWEWFRGLLLREFAHDVSSPDEAFQLFGSWVCDTWVAGSDIDLNLFAESRIPKAFVRIKNAVLADEPAAAVEIVAGARVPVVKIRARDLSFDVTHEYGRDNPVVEHHRQVRDWAQRWAKDESICVCIRIIKLWASANKIHSPTNGTLNSMGYLVMLVAVVGKCSTVDHPEETKTPAMVDLADRNLGDDDTNACNSRVLRQAVQYLERFFEQYATSLGGRRVVLAPDSAVASEGVEMDMRRLSSEVHGPDGTGKGTTLYIQDPFLPQVNLGRFVDKSSLRRIQKAFGRAWDMLREQHMDAAAAAARNVWQRLLEPPPRGA